MLTGKWEEKEDSEKQVMFRDTQRESEEYIKEKMVSYANCGDE